MAPHVLLAVLAAAALHASWNALAKGRGGDPLVTSYLIGLASAVVAAIGLLFTGLPAQASWLYVVLSASVHLAYFTLIGLAYRHADLSAVYPLIRGGAPLFTAILGALLIGENLSATSWGGIVLLSVGIVGLGANGLIGGGLNRKALLAAAATAAVVVTYTLIDGLGARASGTPAGYVLAGSALAGVFLIPFVWFTNRDAVMAAARAGWKKALAAGVMINLSYGVALWAMTHAPIGVVGALRETSVLFGTLIGAVVLKERFGPARWIGAGAIVAGMLLIQAG